MKKRIKFIIVLFVLFWILLLSRLYYLSIKSNKYYQELANRNIINREYLMPTRGEIRDNRGSIIALNRLGFSISLTPHLTKKSKISKLDNAISFISVQFPEFTKERLLKLYKKYDTPYNHKPIKIINFIPYKKMIKKFVDFSQHKEIIIQPATKRSYPYKDIASHIIGYVAKANEKEIKDNKVAKYLGVVGKNGIEKEYEKILGGEIGKREVKVTASNREIGLISSTKPISSDITLTIDMRVQKYIKELFSNISGAIMILNIEDGSILAAGSYPEYDLNLFVKGIDKESWKKMITDLDHPFTNKFIQGLYPPGSSTKPAVALSFLNSKLVDEKEKFLCSGELWLGKRKFRCWNSYGHGSVNIRRAISESCDDYFYKGGLRVGIDKISTDLTRYGFGQKTGVDLPNEFIGTVPSRNWKINKFGESWYKGETLNTVIGQGNFLATPIQVAQFTAMIASGKQVIPHFVQKIDKKDLNYTKKTIFNPYELEKLQIIKKGMYDVCNAKMGTATKYNSAMITIAGKTGTSQVVGIPQEEKERMSEDDLKYYQKSHAWFTTFGPYQKPKYVVTALIEHGGHGGAAAGEIVSKIYNKLVELGYIDKKFIRKDYNPTLPENNSTKEEYQTVP
jgi:penicillin-binding protein 2